MQLSEIFELQQRYWGPQPMDLVYLRFLKALPRSLWPLGVPLAVGRVPRRIARALPPRLKPVEGHFEATLEQVAELIDHPEGLRRPQRIVKVSGEHMSTFMRLRRKPRTNLMADRAMTKALDTTAGLPEGTVWQAWCRTGRLTQVVTAAADGDPARALANLGPSHGPREPSLERRILAAPDEPGPALIYADWLLERGCAHGALIAAHTREPETPSPSGPGARPPDLAPAPLRSAPRASVRENVSTLPTGPLDDWLDALDVDAPVLQYPHVAGWQHGFLRSVDLGYLPAIDWLPFLSGRTCLGFEALTLNSDHLRDASWWPLMPGVKRLRVELRWQAAEPDVLDRFPDLELVVTTNEPLAEQARQRGLQVLTSLVRKPPWLGPAERRH